MNSKECLGIQRTAKTTMLRNAKEPEKTLKMANEWLGTLRNLMEPKEIPRTAKNCNAKDCLGKLKNAKGH